MTSSNDIRATFLDYFARNGHAVVESSPLVPRNDPTLMFANSGMVQFKNVFTGQEKRPYNRATTAQKCVRAGGKHNDLDNVGYTARHHTFFEMLGNFSFGDYFKEQAIAYAWELLTRDFALPREQAAGDGLLRGRRRGGAIWRKVAGLPEERIIRIATSDNFWRMGDTGPCGPCSEIFYDHGPEIPGGPPGSPDEDGDRFVEIWNLVFMQYEEGPPGVRAPLPRPSIDTGMGLERFAAIMQGKHDNYDTDTFRAIILASAEATGQAPDGPFQASHRVVADHLRAGVFLIADGVLPSNEGRGYVLRRILRRAMRHAHMMGAREPLLPRLVPVLVRQMGAAYPEIVRAEALATETLRLEETRFRSLLERGLGLLAEETARLGSGQALPGEVAFRLYDTYGFPLDLTQDALRAEGRAVDVAGFEAAMAEQRRRARAAWAGSGEAATEGLWFDVKERVGATEFLGYSTETAEGEILAVVADGAVVERAPAGTEVAVVLNQTPFYAESGGQVGDAGLISAGEACRIVVRDTQKKLGDLFVHLGTVAHGEARPGLAVQAEVDHARRGEHPRAPLGDAPAARGAAAAPRRARGAEGQPERAGPAALRRLAADADARRRPRLGGGRGERAHPRERRGGDAADDAGGGGGGRRHGAVRREVRRRGARGRHGARPGGHGEARRLLAGALRRHACEAHGRHRPVQDRLRGRGLGRRAARRGGDRRGGAAAGGGERPAAAGSGGGAARLAGRGAGARRGAAGGPAAAGARAGGAPQEARHRRRGGRGGGGRRAARWRCATWARCRRATSRAWPTPS